VRPLNLNSILDARSIDIINNLTQLRFTTPRFYSAGALVAYEQQLINEETLLRLCQECYDVPIVEPKVSYIAQDIMEKFRGKDCIPISFDPDTDTIIVGTLPELNPQIYDDIYRINKVYIPIYRYVELHQRYYGELDFLSIIPALDLYKAICTEAIDLKAADITMTAVGEGVDIYYNVSKKNIYSKRIISQKDLESITNILLQESQTKDASYNGNNPTYLSVNIGKHHRGRVCIVNSHYGRCITIRLLSNDINTQTLSTLNIHPDTQDFIRNVMLSEEKGLRLFIGPPMSGKNTTIVTALQDLAQSRTKKIVSVESPVETIVPGIVQIPAETKDEFSNNVNALLRQNPDLIFIAEISDATAMQTIHIANTGIVAFSTIHANSVAEVLFRLCDLTSLSVDRILVTLQSCVFQELKYNDEGKLLPNTRHVHFTTEFKQQLYGKSLKEIREIIAEEEAKNARVL